jgi:hypothetical protein
MGSRKPVWQALLAAGVLVCGAPRGLTDYYPIHVGFMWHMHQPIYYPYESIIETEAAQRFSFSVIDVHNQRFGPYTTWPRDAVDAGLDLPHLGAQVSFTGSLIENLNDLAAAGVNGGMWTNWDAGYDQAVSWTTTLGNPRLDMVAFGYHHPLMPLLDEPDIRMQIRLHKHIYGQTWNGGPTYSHGLFPAETAFSERMIPALVAEGLDWVLVDNIHFDRACLNYPHTNQSGLFAPNPADQLNPDPAASGGAWVQLNDIWAPSPVSAPFGYQPHYVQYVDPDTGAITQMIAVPAARYEGNEDGRGGYGAFLYDVVMDQYIVYNTDAAHPMFVVLHHDGDNYGGGTDAYYHYNFQQMVAWATADPDYDVSTVADYLDRFPPAADDVIHVEDGSWSGADNGDPEFKKWLGDPDATGWSPDYNSWAVLAAAKNRVFTAEAIAPATDMQNVMTGTGSNTEKAWHWLLCGEASDYWYWDGTEIWDSNVTRACNQAVVYADQVIAGHPDTTPPTVFLPQRHPYNPGGYEWGSTPEASDFEVWTLVYDLSGLANVTLKWRVDADGVNPLDSIQNETYAGGPEVGPWNEGAMTAAELPPPPGGVLPAAYRALRYGAMITAQTNVLIDYYVEAVDGQGNLQKSTIQHVWVGEASGGPGGDVVTIAPDPAQAGQNVTITYNPGGRPLVGAPRVYLHYGFNDWNPIVAPDPAMTWNGGGSVWEVTVPVLSYATQLDLCFHDGAGTWDNNDGADWHFPVEGGTPPPGWVMDGQLDAAARLVAQNGAVQLYAGLDGTTLYVAAPDAGEGNDHFIFVAATPGALRAAPWSKAGQVANWSAFLGNENNDGWSGWFDTSAPAQSATGGGTGWLEGTLDLATELGSAPDVVYLAFAPYATADGGALVSSAQAPPSVDGDGNVDAVEYAAFALRMVGDMNCDGTADFADINPFVLFLSNEASWQVTFPGCNPRNGDINDDGTYGEGSFGDINPFVMLLSQ